MAEKTSRTPPSVTIDENLYGISGYAYLNGIAFSPEPTATARGELSRSSTLTVAVGSGLNEEVLGVWGICTRPCEGRRPGSTPGEDAFSWYHKIQELSLVGLR